MNLQAYLDRIGFDGVARPDADTLKTIHHQHLLSITYENLSVHLGEAVGLDPAESYDKIVEGRRGGWCYEMNGLLGWALQEIGFDVMRMSAGVLRSTRGDSIIGNHLALAVHMEDGPWLADVGFGDGLREPVPLTPGAIEQFGLHYRLELRDDGYWRLHNHEHGGAADFDFRYERAEEARLNELCTWLQTSEESQFVRTLICQRFRPDRIEVLRGRVRRTVTPDGAREWLLQDVDEFQREVRETFELHIEVNHLWQHVVAQHEKVFGPSN